MTYEAVAKILGVTKQRVMQIEAEALKKLKFRLRKIEKELQA